MKTTLVKLITCLFWITSLFGNPDRETEETRDLMAIVELERALVQRLESDVPEVKLTAEVTMRIIEIQEAYERYLEKFPNNVIAQILYGKFLRKSDQPNKAHDLFLSINENTPEIPVVIQHLALYCSETGKYRDALGYFEQALSLDASHGIIHYQYGEFLHTYRNTLIRQDLVAAEKLETRMHNAFSAAHQLEPENRDFHMRWAESFFDLADPDWKEAIAIWDHLLQTSRNTFERDVIRLQKARVSIALSNYDEARHLIGIVREPSLRESCERLLAQIP